MGNHTSCTSIDILANVDGSQTRKKLDINKIGIREYFIKEDILENMVKRENELWKSKRVQDILTNEDSIILGMNVLHWIRVILLNEFEIKEQHQQSAMENYKHYIEYIKEKKTHPIVNKYIKTLYQKKEENLKKNQQAPDIAITVVPKTEYDPHDDMLSSHAIDRFKSNILQEIMNKQQTNKTKKKHQIRIPKRRRNSMQATTPSTPSTPKRRNSLQQIGEMKKSTNTNEKTEEMKRSASTMETERPPRPSSKRRSSLQQETKPKRRHSLQSSQQRKSIEKYKSMEFLWKHSELNERIDSQFQFHHAKLTKNECSLSELVQSYSHVTPVWILCGSGSDPSFRSMLISDAFQSILQQFGAHIRVICIYTEEMFAQNECPYGRQHEVNQATTIQQRIAACQLFKRTFNLHHLTWFVDNMKNTAKRKYGIYPYHSTIIKEGKINRVALNGQLGPLYHFFESQFKLAKPMAESPPVPHHHHHNTSISDVFSTLFLSNSATNQGVSFDPFAPHTSDPREELKDVLHRYHDSSSFYLPQGTLRVPLSKRNRYCETPNSPTAIKDYSFEKENHLSAP